MDFDIGRVVTDTDPVVVIHGADKGKLVTLVEPLVVYMHGTQNPIEAVESFRIPSGFKTDFASVPRIFRGFAGRFGRHASAAIIHDYLCEEANAGRYDRNRADSIFLVSMKCLGVYWYRRYPMYWFVALYTKTKWKWWDQPRREKEAA